MSESVILDVELNSPISSVWNALTTPETLSKWMMFRTNDFKPEVGHTFQFKDAPSYDGVIDCEVTEVREPHSLSYTWTTIGQGDEPHATVVTWTLKESGEGTTSLHLEQTGFRTGAHQELGGARYGWEMMLDQLKNELASA